MSHQVTMYVVTKTTTHMRQGIVAFETFEEARAERDRLAAMDPKTTWEVEETTETRLDPEDMP